MKNLLLILIAVCAHGYVWEMDSAYTAAGSRTDGPIDVYTVPHATAPESLLVRNTGDPRIKSYPMPDLNNVAAHAIDGSDHTASGLTPGWFMKATGATTFAFEAHGLTYSDVGGAAAAHTHDDRYHTETELTSGTIDLRLDSVSIRVMHMSGVPSAGSTSDSILVLKNGVPSYISKTTFRSDIGAEPSIATGTTAQYFRGDKSWVNLVVAAVGGLLDSLADKLPLHGKADSCILADSTKKMPRLSTAFRLLGTDVNGDPDTTGVFYSPYTQEVAIPGNLFMDTTGKGTGHGNGIMKFGTGNYMWISTGGYPSAALGCFMQLSGADHNYGNFLIQSATGGDIEYTADEHKFYFQNISPSAGIAFVAPDATTNVIIANRDANARLRLAGGSGWGIELYDDKIYMRDTVIFEQNVFIAGILTGYHGVTPGNLVKAATDSTLENSISEAALFDLSASRKIAIAWEIRFHCSC